MDPRNVSIRTQKLLKKHKTQFLRSSGFKCNSFNPKNSIDTENVLLPTTASAETRSALPDKNPQPQCSSVLPKLCRALKETESQARSIDTQSESRIVQSERKAQDMSHHNSMATMHPKNSPQNSKPIHNDFLNFFSNW